MRALVVSESSPVASTRGATPKVTRTPTPSCYRVIARIGERGFRPIVAARSAIEAVEKAARIADGLGPDYFPWTTTNRRAEQPAFTWYAAVPSHRRMDHREPRRAAA